jgi:hypothetical protein
MFIKNNHQGDGKDRKYSNKMGNISYYMTLMVVDYNDLLTCIKFPIKIKVVVDEEKESCKFEMDQTPMHTFALNIINFMWAMEGCKQERYYKEHENNSPNNTTNEKEVTYELWSKERFECDGSTIHGCVKFEEL